ARRAGPQRRTHPADIQALHGEPRLALRPYQCRAHLDRPRHRADLSPQHVLRHSGIGMLEFLVPRTRSSHDHAASPIANFGFKGALGSYACQCPFASEALSRDCRNVLRMTALLRGTLAPELPDAIYVVMHEIEHDAYGRDGVTRAERD